MRLDFFSVHCNLTISTNYYSMILTDSNECLTNCFNLPTHTSEDLKNLEELLIGFNVISDGFLAAQ